jgi:hypothetical protein
MQCISFISLQIALSVALAESAICNKAYGCPLVCARCSLKVSSTIALSRLPMSVAKWACVHLATVCLSVVLSAHPFRLGIIPQADIHGPAAAG